MTNILLIKKVNIGRDLRYKNKSPLESVYALDFKTSRSKYSVNVLGRLLSDFYERDPFEHMFYQRTAIHMTWKLVQI